MHASTATRVTLLPICALILVGLLAPTAHAAISVDIGSYRALAEDFVQWKFGVSAEQAVSVVHRYEEMHGDRIIDRLELPEGAVLDFVRVDGRAPDPASMVTYEGSGVLRSTPAALSIGWLKSALEKATPAERARLQESIRAALERGWFVQPITAEMANALMRNNRAPGETAVGTQAVERKRILVVLNNFPHWDDVSPSAGRYDARSDYRNHPLMTSEGWGTPGGPLSTSNFQPVGLANPSWSHTGSSPSGGSNDACTNHPRIEYTVDGRPGTSVDLAERWHSFLFDRGNPLSVANYYFANSHGNLSIEGNRSDIVGPLESHHMLDRIPLLGGAGHDYAIQPGTPVIRQTTGPDFMGIPGCRGFSVDTTNDTIATLGYGGGISVSSVMKFNTGTGDFTDPLPILSTYTNPYDSRRVYKITAFAPTDRIRATIGGVPIELTPFYDLGFPPLSDTGLTSADVLGSDVGNRLLSMCYYTHDHAAEDGRMGSRPYQLLHTRNTAGQIDDIGGTVDDSRDHADRPKPYDHDIIDHAQGNMGYFEGRDSNGGHTYDVWLSHLDQVMADNGIEDAGYNLRIALYPSDTAGEQDQGGTSGPWSGSHVFIPNSAVVLPESAGLYLAAHELGHALCSFVDLYDLDFYTNAGLKPQPPLFECSMIGPYSVMAHGGCRVDAFSKALTGWIRPIAVTQDIINASIPEIEGTREDPIVYKLPGRPFYIAHNVPPDEWQEFFLVENRNRTGANYFNDISPRGLYIYHVDMRFGQTDEEHPMVIVEQADGLYELERNPDREWGDIESDPFPGSLGVREWTQFTNPNSYSHGWKSGVGLNQMRPATELPPAPPGGVLQPGSSTDSFARVANISDPGPNMTADLHVVPREVIATLVPIPDLSATVPQGAKDFWIMHLRLENDRDEPNLSRDDVELATIRLDETGSSQDDRDIDRVSLWDDTNGNGVFDPTLDTRIAVANYQGQSLYFTDLNYRVPLDEVRNLFVTYDVSDSANASPGVSLGAGMATFDYIRPKTPGAVQQRVRETISDTNDGLGDFRFPLASALVNIEETPDTITVTPTSLAPTAIAAAEVMPEAINPGDVDVPILGLRLDVDHDQAGVIRLRVDQTGSMNAVAHITSAKLYLDADGNGQVGAGDTLLEETTFALVAGVQRAVFDIQANPVVVTEGGPRHLLLTASISPAMPLEEPPLTLVYTLQDPSYLKLLQPEDIVSDENFPMSSDEVSTPIPNDPPSAPQNLTAVQIGDGSIRLNWELSADDPAVGGEADVTEYHIYRSTDPAALVNAAPADVYATVGAGETQFNDVSAPINVDFYYMVRAYDDVQEGPNSNIAGPVQAADLVPPVFSNFVPAPDAENVPLDTTITFTVSDTSSGVDRASLVFEVDGVDVIDDPNTTITGGAQQLRVEYDPPEDFDFLQRVEVRLQAADNSGNVAPGPGQFETYNFSVVGPPAFSIAGVITDAQGNPEPNVRVRAGQLFAFTDAQGVYQITGLAAGSYSVTPSKDKRSFTPESRSVTVGPNAVAIDFTSALGFDLGGIVLTPGGDSVAGVSISDGLHTVLTGADGRWQIDNVAAGTYTIVPQLPGYVFTPPMQDATVNAQAGNDLNVDFVAAPETFDVTGTIRTVAGDRLAGITVEALSGGNVVATTQTGTNGAYALSGLEPGSYVVRPSDSNYQFDPTEATVDVATDVASVDFVAARVYQMSLPQGLAFVAVPITPVNPDPLAAFGNDVQVARWDPLNSPPYLLAPSSDPLMQLAPGRGFWTSSPRARTLSIAGEVFPNTENLALNLSAGWNMCGNPYDRDLGWKRLSFPTGSPASRYGFIYDRGDATYRLVSTAPGLGARTVVPRYAGYWHRSGASTTITINAPGAVPASEEVAAQAERRPGPKAWVIPIVARAAAVMDAASLAGVLPQAATDPATYRADNPPAISPFVDLYFLGEDGRRLAVDVRPAAAATEVWSFAVATDMADVQVELSLPDLSEVPADKLVYLVDETAGKRMYARTMATYSYDAGAGGERRFRLEVADRADTGLMITGAAAVAVGGRVSVSYTLSSAAQVSLEVLNIAGRKVATLGGEVQPAGVSTASWNGRSASGTICPPGRYLVRINARADDGRQAQAIVPVQLGR